jgi:lipid II:glycine glycyltransferase (peptidoglycan interpeptide bridge formation enzyme)|tara:strand:+ start:411 stop:608 length:198 start_codon:yes stop_codon:yes gene_type:complete
MPTLNIDENINRLQNSIEQMTHEIFRMQGMLKTFTDLKAAGVNNIELPNQGLEKIEEESTQEKPE